MAKERFAFVDLVRVIAIFLIVLFHFWYQITFDESLRTIGFVGVSLFFIASGYTLTKHYSNHVSFSFKWFFRRILKIALIYYLALVLVALLFGRQAYSGNLFFNLLAHFSFTDSFFPEYSYGLISPAWFFAPLVVLYLFFPYINKIIKKNWFFILPAFVITFLFRFYNPFFTSTNFLFFLAEFCFGIAFAYRRSLLLVLVSLLIIFIRPVMVLPFVLFYILSFTDHVSDFNLLRIISKYSVAIFLFHEALMNLIFDKWQIFYFSKVYSILIFVGVSIFVTYLSSILQRKILSD
ncbi:Acyltransferase family protein [uncultured archaeon]|nr:Acyltransferase family protein [uncultured archaeon]